MNTPQNTPSLDRNSGISRRYLLVAGVSSATSSLLTGCQKAGIDPQTHIELYNDNKSIKNMIPNNLDRRLQSLYTYFLTNRKSENIIGGFDGTGRKYGLTITIMTIPSKQGQSSIIRIKGQDLFSGVDFEYDNTVLRNNSYEFLSYSTLADVLGSIEHNVKF